METACRKDRARQRCAGLVNMSMLDRFAPWSISKSDLAAKCGRAFHLRYVQRLPRTTSEASRIGTAAHRVQELLLRGLDPKEALAQGLAEALDLTSKERLAVEALLPNMVKFKSRLDSFKDKHGVLDEGFERDVAITKTFARAENDASDVFVRGVIDYDLHTKSDYVVVIDHKSGREHPVEKYSKQLDLYAVLVEAARPCIKGVHAALHYIATGNIVWHHPRPVATIRKTLRPHMMEYLATRANSLGTFEPRVNALCGWCDYLQHCPEGTAAVAAKKEEKRVATNTRARERRVEKKRALTVVYEDAPTEDSAD
jgi:hypothetical protein